MTSNSPSNTAKNILNSLNVSPISGRINTATGLSLVLKRKPTVLSVSLSKKPVTNNSNGLFLIP